MNKIFKCIVILVLLFSYTYVKAKSCDDYKTQEAKYACKKTEEYCDSGISPEKGCIYDKNDSLYSHSGEISDKTWFLGNSIKSNNAPLVRGWQTVDKDGNGVFAGCYKDKVKDHEYRPNEIFVFKIVGVEKGTCQVIGYDIVPVAGFFLPSWLAGGTTYDGWNGVGGDLVKYSGKWKATPDIDLGEGGGGVCPQYFGMTNDSKYVFAMNPENVDVTVKSWIFFDKKLETNVGCTVEDKKVTEEALECFEGAINDINNYQCPSDLKDFDSLKETLEGYHTKCDTYLKQIFALDYLKENSEKIKESLNKAFEEKLNSCQISKCDVTLEQHNKIQSEVKGKTCENGCSSGTTVKPSDSDKAVCYQCNDGMFYWVDNNLDYYVENCSLVNKTKEECISSDNTNKCFTCLKESYKKAGLSDKQITCLIGSELEKEEARRDMASELDKQRDDFDTKKVEENKEQRSTVISENISARAEHVINDPNIDIVNETKECAEILGSNLTNIVKAFITIIQIVGLIITIVKGMMILIPPIMAKDADALKKATSTLIKLGIVLLIILIFRPIIRLLGVIFEFDLSCIV